MLGPFLESAGNAPQPLWDRGIKIDIAVRVAMLLLARHVNVLGFDALEYLNFFPVSADEHAVFLRHAMPARILLVRIVRAIPPYSELVSVAAAHWLHFWWRVFVFEEVEKLRL